MLLPSSELELLNGLAPSPRVHSRVSRRRRVCLMIYGPLQCNPLFVFIHHPTRNATSLSTSYYTRYLNFAMYIQLHPPLFTCMQFFFPAHGGLWLMVSVRNGAVIILIRRNDKCLIMPFIIQSPCCALVGG